MLGSEVEKNLKKLLFFFANWWKKNLFHIKTLNFKWVAEVVAQVAEVPAVAEVVSQVAEVPGQLAEVAEQIAEAMAFHQKQTLFLYSIRN